MSKKIKNLDAKLTTVEELQTLSEEEFRQIELPWFCDWVKAHGEEGLAFFSNWIENIGGGGENIYVWRNNW